MIRISQVKLPVGHTKEALTERIASILKIKPNQKRKGEESFSFRIEKRSIDGRRKPDLYYVYTVAVTAEEEEALVRRAANPSVTLAQKKVYTFPKPGDHACDGRIVIVGAGPCGLFAALQLAEAGYAPVLLERGQSVKKRREAVNAFWESGVLDTESNVQFGEGGAGTFSDGKLNTAVKDRDGKAAYVLEAFVRFGAPEEILFDSRPHIGTDILISVIEKMREYLLLFGAEIFFETHVTDLVVSQGRCRGVVTNRGILPAAAVVLAPGHSARDTFSMLQERNVSMEAKSFAVGFRVEHPQEMIDLAMYGRKKHPLSAAPYRVTSNFPNGRGVYSFCMCPGGFVVNASSEEGGVCVNGMSYSERGSKNANSAIIVSVTPKDFGGDGPLSGVLYQRRLERSCFASGGGAIPQQLLGDFIQNRKSTDYGDFASEAKGRTVLSNLRGLLAPELESSFLSGMAHFSRIIENFDRKDAILSGVEARTSSPVRILRDEQGQCSVKRLYPCGEGAGYAGGIMSAAMDGLRTASLIMEQYAPPRAEPVLFL